MPTDPGVSQGDLEKAEGEDDAIASLLAEERRQRTLETPSPIVPEPEPVPAPVPVLEPEALEALEAAVEEEEETVDEAEVATSAVSVVINEIMFHPQPENEREPIAKEYIEFYNAGDEAVDLKNYRVTRGVSFTFPALTLRPGGYVVITPDEAAFRATYGRSAKTVLGKWTGRLSNSGEEIRLEDSEGGLVDRVAYADQGDWAVRTRSSRAAMSHRSSFSGRVTYSRSGGSNWSWECRADGEGASLELISAKMTNNHGANWQASQGRGTPGGPNSVRATDVAPLISKVRHNPVVPQPNQRVLILAEIEDETPGDIQAQVHWRVSSRRSQMPFQVVPMKAMASGRYAAALPPHPNRTVIEFYVKATDGRASRNWPAGPDGDARANALYQVDSETNRTAMAFYRLIMTEEDNQRFGMNRHSNALTNTTLIADDGSGPVIRYLCGTRVRGAGSRNNTPPPMRVNLPRDRPWNGATRMNLNSVYPWLQYIGMKIFQASRLPAPNMLPVQVRRNGVDTTRKSSKDYGAFVHAQPLDGNFLDEHYAHDDGGNLYKKVRPDSDWAWRRGAVHQYQNDGWLKQTNNGENDWTDLDRFLGVMNTAPRQPDYLGQVARVMDVDQWLRYLAVMALLANGEGGIANGIDDDYAIYRGIADGRFQALPHDLDTILGIGEATSNPQHTLFDFAERGNELEPLEPLFDQRQIRQRYFTIMSELIETSFSNREFRELLDRHLAGWVPTSTIRRMEDFMALRTAYASREIQRAIGRRPQARPAPTSLASQKATATAGTVVLNEILAQNVTAHEHGGNFPDVIELYNPDGKAVSLAGMSLTDNAEKPGKYIFPEGASIAAKGYLLVYADALTVEGEYHSGFSLKREGETLSLFGPPSSSNDGNGKRKLLDSITFGPQLADHSIGRGGPRNDVWALTVPTLGEANQSVGLGNVRSVRINEWLASPEARFSDDYIELINVGDRPVSLGGVAVTTNYVTAPDEHCLPALSYIAPKGFLLLESLGKRSVQRHACDLPFRLPSHHGWIRLVGTNGTDIDKVHYVCQRPDIAQGRLPNGGETIAYLTVPTPGLANGAARETPSTVRGLLLGLRVSEIMYHPVNGELEYIELTNILSEPLNLEGVQFTGGIDYVFRESEVLEPGECLVLVQNREAFVAEYGEDIRIAGEYEGKLSNGGETLELSLPKPANMAIQRFEYDDKWYATTDGRGTSLTVVDLRTDVKRWEDLTNWRPSPGKGGTPGSL